MKQLLIVGASTALNGGASNPKDLSGMAAGSVGIYKLSAPGSWAADNAALAEDFAICYGRPNSPAVVIPEVDFKTLEVNIADPDAGETFEAEITVPDACAGDTFTIVLIKKGALPHERNTWTATETVYDDTDDETMADKLAAYFTRMAVTGSLPVTVSVSGAVITIAGVSTNDTFEIKTGDDLPSSAITDVTYAEPAIGDKAYIENLASMCAQNRGFSDTDAFGPSIYPAYPMAVENTSYKVFTLRFATSRKSAKTRDEVVSQLVHIAVPRTASTLLGKLTTMLTITGKTRKNS